MLFSSQSSDHAGTAARFAISMSSLGSSVLGSQSGFLAICLLTLSFISLNVGIELFGLSMVDIPKLEWDDLPKTHRSCLRVIKFLRFVTERESGKQMVVRVVIHSGLFWLLTRWPRFHSKFMRLVELSSSWDLDNKRL